MRHPILGIKGAKPRIAGLPKRGVSAIRGNDPGKAEILPCFSPAAKAQAEAGGKKAEVPANPGKLRKAQKRKGKGKRKRAKPA
jgi:hypothetical protein